MSNIIETSSEQNSLQKIRKRLDQTQRVAGEVEQRLAEARTILRSYSRKDGKVRYDSFYEMVVEAAKNSEYLTDYLRRLTLELSFDPKQYLDYKNDLVMLHGIEVEYTDRIVGIKLPVLVPHRKSSYTDFIYKPLYTALQNWCMERTRQHLELPIFQRATICFIHCYDEKLPLARVRDHDNIEEKHVLDAVASFFLESDGALWVNTYHKLQMGSQDRTYLFIMEQDAFPKWIQTARNPL